MKKFASALLAATAIVTSAYADGAVTGGESKTGFYLGGNVGANNTNVKYNFITSGVQNGTSTAITAAQTNNWNNQSGSMGALFGLFAGYGMQVGSMYFGGEAYAGLDTAKVTTYNDNGTGASSSPFFNSQIKRTSYYGFAPRIGAFITASTMVYARFGIEGGKWQATVTNAANAVATGTSVGPFKSSKNSISFAPGVGVETYFTKNLFLRAEYSYLFGPKVTVVQDSAHNNSFQGSVVTHTFNVTQQAFKVGVGYKF